MREKILKCAKLLFNKMTRNEKEREINKWMKKKTVKNNQKSFINRFLINFFFHQVRSLSLISTAVTTNYNYIVMELNEKQ